MQRKSSPPLHTALVPAVAWSPNGEMFASSGEYEVNVFDRDGGELLKSFDFDTVDGALSDLAWSPDSELLAVAERDRPHLLDVDTGEVRTLTDPNGPGENNQPWSHGITWDPTGAQIARSAGDGTTIVWEVSTGDVVARLADPEASAEEHISDDAAWSPTGEMLATIANDVTVTLWDTENWGTVHGDGRLRRRRR